MTANPIDDDIRLDELAHSAAPLQHHEIDPAGQYIDLQFRHLIRPPLNFNSISGGSVGLYKGIDIINQIREQQAENEREHEHLSVSPPHECRSPWQEDMLEHLRSNNFPRHANHSHFDVDYVQKFAAFYRDLDFSAALREDVQQFLAHLCAQGILEPTADPKCFKKL